MKTFFPNAARVLWLLSAMVLLCAGAAEAQLAGERPDELKNVGVDPKLGDKVPLEVKFRDESGQVLALQDVFAGERPVLLSLNYSDCPMLCRVQLDALVDTLKLMDWTVGKEYDVVSVSINPLETPQRALKTEQKYVERYGRPGTSSGWRFLVGPEPNIKKLADAVGFKYEYVEERQEYAHTAALMVMTPDGVVSRYFYGVAYQPETLRLSMVEAAGGKVGSLTDQILLFCFHYNDTTGQYSPVAKNIMSAAAAVTVAALAVGLLPFWLRKPARSTATPASESNPVAEDSTPLVGAETN